MFSFECYICEGFGGVRLHPQICRQSQLNKKTAEYKCGGFFWLLPHLCSRRSKTQPKNPFTVPIYFLEPAEAHSSNQGFLGCFSLFLSFCWLKHFPNAYIELELVS